MHLPPHAHVRSEDSLLKSVFFLLPCGSGGSNSGPQAPARAPLPSEPTVPVLVSYFLRTWDPLLREVL